MHISSIKKDDNLPKKYIFLFWGLCLISCMFLFLFIKYFEKIIFDNGLIACSSFTCIYFLYIVNRKNQLSKTALLETSIIGAYISLCILMISIYYIFYMAVKCPLPTVNPEAFILCRNNASMLFYFVSNYFGFVFVFLTLSVIFVKNFYIFKNLSSKQRSWENILLIALIVLLPFLIEFLI